ncbi:S24 family peptidase [Sphingobium sp. HWE2-09]|uniref:S24 family peptidase n=1 Tax=Sphingobium sp. HWE2-09 TaxID=3108390 RepID=UPI002DC8E9CA|nr:S24 family peptidase [Sphingobium sp. HWE2-09]
MALSDPVRQTLKHLIQERGQTYAGLSNLLQRNPAYFQQFMTRGTPRKLDEEDRRILARYFGVPEEALGKASDPVSMIPKMEQIIVTVPRLALGVCAGTGALTEAERIVGMVTFDARWLRRLGIDPERASVVSVDGDSMSPTLLDGDDILVDHADAVARLRDGVYILGLDGVLLVKRLVMGPRRWRLSALSDNPQYPDWTDIDPTLVTIIGRVAWVGRRFS